MSKIKRAVSDKVTEPPPGLWSNCLVVDGIAYVSGMTARSRTDFNTVVGDREYEQAKAIFAKIRDVLRAAGGEMSDIVDAVLYLEGAGFVTGEILHVDGGQSAGH